MRAGSKKIRWIVMLPPWIILTAFFALSLVDYDLFLSVTSTCVSVLLDKFAWMFNWITLGSVILVIATYLLPVGRVRIGGAGAVPIISYRNYIWIVLCTIMGAGLMLWVCAEPMYHLTAPPSNVAAGAYSGEAVLWAMENILLEWTFPAMALYGIPTVLFAFVFYNMRKKFSVGSMLTPLLGDRRVERWSVPIDIICLFSIVAGLSCTLGSGILLIMEGVTQVSGGRIRNDLPSWIICGLVIVAAYTISASTGLKKGIKYLSTINSWFYLAIGIFVFLAGPSAYILNLLSDSFGAFLSDFFRLSLNTSTASGGGWSHWWAQFYWLIAFAWMPISSVFLGRISKGYTVRQVLNVVFLIPSIFSVIWVSIFSCSSIYYELEKKGIYASMTEGTIASASYAVIRCLPLAGLLMVLFIIAAFLSYVTSADSNTNAIASLCTAGLSEEDAESPLILKVFWGLTTGAVCIAMLSAYGMDGMKMLADLGGFPSAFLMIGFLVSWILIMRNPAGYDVHKNDYGPDGRPV